MTEIEKIKRAKTYMDMLANGIDPISGKEAPENDIINNVRLSRCFFFVSDVLKQVIENDRVLPQKKEKKTPFSITREDLDKYQFSDSPIPVSEIAKRITSLSPQSNMQQMRYASITNWLSELGLLMEITTSSGQKTKRPTKEGLEMGITLEERTGNHGTYHVVVYNQRAQQFIVDNLDDVLRSENIAGKLQGQPWSKEHDECLADLFRKGVPESEIAITLKRSTSSIRSRIRKLGL